MTTERLTDEEFVAMCEHIEASTDLPWGRHRDEIIRLDTRPDAKHEFLCERVLAIQPWDDDHDPIGESQEEVDVALMLVAVNALPALLDEVDMSRLSLVRAVNDAVKAERAACAEEAAHLARHWAEESKTHPAGSAARHGYIDMSGAASTIAQEIKARGGS